MLDRIQTRHYLMVLTVFAFVVGQSNCAKKSKISAKKNVVQAASVQLSEASLKLNRGDSKEVSAKAFRDTGVEALIGPRGEEILFAWSGCDPNIATVTATGAKAVITGAGEGKCTVQVDSSGYNPARLEIEVSPAVPTSIQISPSEATVARDAEIALTVAAVYSDGSNKDISDAVTWEGIPSGVIDFRQGSRIVGISIGSATAKATYAGISAEIPVFVKDPELKSIVILTSGQPSYIGAGLQFSALGVYEDGSTADLTSQVDWISSDSTKVSFSDSALKGFALLKASGVGQITAQLGAQTATRQITVNGASLRHCDCPALLTSCCWI